MEYRKDELEKNMSRANRVCSTADGPNILQCNAEARLNQIDRHHQPIGSYGPMSSSETDWKQQMLDHEYRARFKHHFEAPGGMTFRRGQVLLDEEK